MSRSLYYCSSHLPPVLKVSRTSTPRTSAISRKGKHTQGTNESSRAHNTQLASTPATIKQSRRPKLTEEQPSLHAHHPLTLTLSVRNLPSPSRHPSSSPRSHFLCFRARNPPHLPLGPGRSTGTIPGTERFFREPHSLKFSSTSVTPLHQH